MRKKKQQRRTLSGVDIIIFVILGVIIFFGGGALFVDSSSQGAAPTLPEYRMKVDMRSRVFESALSKCDWCEVSTSASNLTIEAVEVGRFNNIINANGNAEEMAKNFPELYEWNQEGNSCSFVIKRNFKLFGGGTVPVPTWLVHSLIKSDVLKPSEK